MKKLFTLAAISVLLLAACDKLFNQDYEDVSKINAAFIGKWSGTYVNNGEEALVTFDITKDSWVLVFYYDDGNMTSTNGSCYRDGSGSLTLYSSTGGGTGTASLSGDDLILNTGGLFGYNTPSLSIQFKKGSSSTGGTTLTIKNESSYEITNVTWDNNDFTKGSASIKSGKSKTLLVKEGNGYLFFTRKTYPINARTDDIIVVEKNVPKVFTIINNTLIYDRDNPSKNKDKLDTLGITKAPQITLKADDAVITQLGDYNFGSAFLNTDRDVTFTIGNSGNADLEFSVVSGNVINLSKNASGYFSIVQQPFATMKIIPGGNTTFIIRFSPQTLGNNFNAEVTIVTNSENNAQFTFRVKGDGSNEYKIGDTGPGGGIIFFAQGGQYKECSGELGTYNWTDAVNTAKSYQGGGSLNWRLPDIGELDLMYRNLKLKSLGGFSNANYWSSTKGSYSYSGYYYFNFSSGSQDSTGEGYICRVRAVQSFSL